MNENIRIIFDNLYDTSDFEDSFNDTIYYTQAFTSNAPNQPIILGPVQATSSMRSDLTSIKPTAHYILDGKLNVPSSMSCLAFVRPKLPAGCAINLTVWNSVDWDTATAKSEDWDDDTDYTARLLIPTIDKAGGWGEFPWMYPWGTNFLSGSPMSSVLIFWFDDDRNIQLLDPDSNIVESPVDDVVAWRLEVIPLETTAIYFDRIYLGKHMDIDYNISHGHSMIFKDSTKQYRTDGGSLVTDMRNRYKSIKFAFSVISPTNRTTFARNMAVAGTHDDILLSVYPLNTSQNLEDDYTLVGKFKKIPVMTEIIGGYYKTTIEVEET